MNWKKDYSKKTKQFQWSIGHRTGLRYEDCWKNVKLSFIFNYFLCHWHPLFRSCLIQINNNPQHCTRWHVSSLGGLFWIDSTYTVLLPNVMAYLFFIHISIDTGWQKLAAATNVSAGCQGSTNQNFCYTPTSTNIQQIQYLFLFE